MDMMEKREHPALFGVPAASQGHRGMAAAMHSGMTNRSAAQGEV